MSAPSIRNVFYNCQMFDDRFLELSVHMKYVGREEKIALTICNLPACERNMEVADNLFSILWTRGTPPNARVVQYIQSPNQNYPVRKLIVAFCGAPDLLSGRIGPPCVLAIANQSLKPLLLCDAPDCPVAHQICQTRLVLCTRPLQSTHSFGITFSSKNYNFDDLRLFGNLIKISTTHSCSHINLVRSAHHTLRRTSPVLRTSYAKHNTSRILGITFGSKL